MIVIGGGPAGYPAAIRAAQNKLKVACIDEWKNKDGTAVFGGTCTNAGCIPSKALLESSELYHKTKEELGVHGIKVGDVQFDVAQMQKRKTGIVKASTTGIAMLLKSAGVTALQGHGKLLAGRKVEFTAHDGKKRNAVREAHRARAAVRSPLELKSMPFDGKNIVDTWGALDFDSVPKKLAVVGAGVIGLELGSVWRRLGAEVVVLEALDTFLAVADQGLAKEAARHFKKQGLDIKLGAKVSGAKIAGSGVEVSYADASGSQTITVDKLIVASAAGRSRRTCWPTARACSSTNAASSRSTTTARPPPKTSGRWATACAAPMLAHKAKDEGVMVGDMIAGRYGHMNYDTIPSVIYTHPEIAWVGQTEEQVKASGRAYKIGQFPFAASGRARAMESTAGFVKLIAAQDDDEILGVHIIGPMAGELIAEAVLAMEYSASSEDLQRTIHAHPTLVRSAARSGAGGRQARHRQHQPVVADASRRPGHRRG